MAKIGLSKKHKKIRHDALKSDYIYELLETEFNILSWFISDGFHYKSPLNLSIILHISSMHQFLNIRYPALISCLTFKIESTTFIDFNIHKLKVVGGCCSVWQWQASNGYFQKILFLCK